MRDFCRLSSYPNPSEERTVTRTVHPALVSGRDSIKDERRRVISLTSRSDTRLMRRGRRVDFVFLDELVVWLLLLSFSWLLLLSISMS